MAEIKIRELPSKIKEVKDKKEEDEDSDDKESLEAIIEEIRAKARARPQAAQQPSRKVNPVLSNGNISQVVSQPPREQSRAQGNAHESSQNRPVVYENSGRQNVYDSSKSRTTERAYQAQNSERKYESSSDRQQRPEESRKVSLVLEGQNTDTGQRGIFGTPQEQRGIQFSDNQDNKREYEVNPLAENQDRKRSRRL